MALECRYIKTSGGKCASPALNGQPYCYFHSRMKERTREPARYPVVPLSKELANLEDPGAIQNAITHVAMALADFHIDNKRAGVLLYALQIASSNVKNTEQIVSSTAVAELTRSEEGEEMAPEHATAGPAQEESMADLLMREIEKQRKREYAARGFQFDQLAENKDLTGI